MEIAQLWEEPAASGNGSPLCVQSPASGNGSASRWQHVILIDRTAADVAHPAAYAWTAPYASCEALWRRDGVGWIAGVFDFSFESAQAVTKTAFVLRSLAQGREMARYVLALTDPANLFSFKATRSTSQ